MTKADELILINAFLFWICVGCLEMIRISRTFCFTNYFMTVSPWSRRLNNLLLVRIFPIRYIRYFVHVLELMCAHTPAFVQLDEINHPIRSVRSFFFLWPKATTHSKHSNRYLFSCARTHMHVSHVHICQTKDSAQCRDIRDGFGLCVREREWMILKRGKPIYVRLFVCVFVMLLERFAYDVWVPSNKQSVKRCRTKSRFAFKMYSRLEWGGTQRTLYLLFHE